MSIRQTLLRKGTRLKLADAEYSIGYYAMHIY
jgi:hypothetical protein